MIYDFLGGECEPAKNIHEYSLVHYCIVIIKTEHHSCDIPDLPIAFTSQKIKNHLFKLTKDLSRLMSVCSDMLCLSKQDNLRMNVAPDQTIILGLQFFLYHRSLSSIGERS